MASIYERLGPDGKPRFQAKVRVKGHPPQSKTFKRKTDARKWAESTEVAIREGRNSFRVESRKHTVKELIQYYLETMKNDPPKTHSLKVQQLGWWVKNLGSYSLDQVSPAVLAKCRNTLRASESRAGANKSAATVNRYLAAFSRVLTVAVRELGYLDANPMLKVDKLKEPKGRERYLLDDERDCLLKACQESDSKDLYFAVVLSLSTGARKMEILGLRWRDVDLKGERITLVETKNDQTRSVAVKGLALDLMRGRQASRRLDTDLVFPGNASRDGRVLPKDLRTPFRTAVKRARLEDFRWHDLRHTAASYLAMNGASLAEIAEVLGHKTLAMVKRYAHLSEAHTSKVVESMNKKMFGGGK